MPEQYKYGGSLYRGGEGKAGVLDKDYYKDLGFSTSKAGAAKTRGMLKGFSEDVAKREEQISGYEGKVKKARADIEGKTKTAWDDYATSTINLAGKTWNLPPEEASKLGKSLSKYWHMEEDKVPEMSEEQKKSLLKPNIRGAIGSSDWKAYRQGVNDWAKENKATFMKDFVPPKGQTYNVQVPGGVWTRKYRPVTAKALQRSKELHLRNKVNKALTLARQGKTHEIIMTMPKVSHAKAHFQAVAQQVDPEVAKARAAYEREYRAQAGEATSELDKQLVEVAKARGVLSSDIATVKGQKQAIAEKQKGRRTGIAETFNSLFRQRGKR